MKMWGIEQKTKKHERIMPKSQQVAKIRLILSNRGAGVDTLDLVDDLVDPTVGYEDNKSEILRSVGFSAESRRGERAMVHEQCPSAIAECGVNGEDTCEFACEVCGDSPACRKLALSLNPRTGEWVKQKPVTKITPTTKQKTKTKCHKKILTDTQIQHARKKGYVNVTIEGVKKRVTKRNFKPRKRNIYWYKSGGKVSLKIVRR